MKKLLILLFTLAVVATHPSFVPADRSQLFAADTNLLPAQRNVQIYEKTVASRTYTLSSTTDFRVPRTEIPSRITAAVVTIVGDDIAYNRTGAALVLSPLSEYRLSEYSGSLILNAEDVKQFRAKCLGTATTIKLEYRSNFY